MLHVTVNVGVGEGVVVGEVVREQLGVKKGEGLAVIEGLSVGVGEGVVDIVWDVESVQLNEGVEVRLQVGVRVNEGVCEMDGKHVGVSKGDSVTVNVGVGDADGVAEGVVEIVKVEVGVKL